MFSVLRMDLRGFFVDWQHSVQTLRQVLPIAEGGHLDLLNLTGNTVFRLEMWPKLCFTYPEILHCILSTPWFHVIEVTFIRFPRKLSKTHQNSIIPLGTLEVESQVPPSNVFGYCLCSRPSLRIATYSSPVTFRPIILFLHMSLLLFAQSVVM